MSSKFIGVGIYNQNSRSVTIFHTFPLLEEGATFAGYAALIDGHELSVPLPESLCAIGLKHKTNRKGRWQMFTPRHRPEDTLYAHLTFALKYEGIDLAVLRALFLTIVPQDIVDIVRLEPTGAYSRKIWFLYEWLNDGVLEELPDVSRGNFVPLIDKKLQYPGPVRNSKRHRVRNNLPGTRAFCPIIRRTETLDNLIEINLSQIAESHIGKTHKDLLSRAAAFLLLKDSKASYKIEGEDAPHNRIERWGRIMGEAGQNPISLAELERLQAILIVDNRFILPGCRGTGGFIGEHDRATNMPVPDHISAKPEDLEYLLNGLMETYYLLLDSDYHAVLMAALIAFGFVFIHPFEDGNGRIHRYLLHHVLAEKGFVPKRLVFPVSAVILERIDEYRKSLESYSKPRLDFIEWRPTKDNNVEVTNETIDLYRYFDATRQAEFLFESVEETVNKTLPEEVQYLSRYDRLNSFIQNYIEMPDRMVDLLIHFLDQNGGKLSNKRYKKDFSALTDEEVSVLEEKYDEIFNDG